LLLKDGLDAVTISPTAIIGPYDFKPSYAGKTLIGVYRGNIPALVGGGFDWVDVRDVPQSALAASEDAPPPGERHIFSGAWRTVSNVYELVGAVTGCDIPNREEIYLLFPFRELFIWRYKINNVTHTIKCESLMERHCHP
jgi:nucleoside-diphosphate-sugar epimerase